MVASAFLAPLD